MSKSNPTRPNPTLHLWVFGVFIGIFLYGFSENLRGALLPSILKDLHLSYSIGGMVLAANPLGFILTPWLAGRWVGRWGFRPLYLTSSLLMIAGFGYFSVAQTLFGLLCGQFLAGLGLGMLQLLTNATLIAHWPQHKARLLSFGAIAFSTGATLAPLFVSHFAPLTADWPLAFGAVLVFAFFYGLPFLFKTPALKSHSLALQEPPQFFSLIHCQGFRRFSLLFICYAIIEIGFSSWLVEFLESHHGLSAQIARYQLSLYFSALLFGRILGSLYLDRWGYRLAALIHLFFFCGAASFLIFAHTSWILIFVAGWSAAVFFPVITALASDQFGNRTQEALGVFYSLAGIGGIIALWGIGRLGEVYGLKSAMLVILGAGFAMILSIGSFKK